MDALIIRGNQLREYIRNNRNWLLCFFVYFCLFKYDWLSQLAFFDYLYTYSRYCLCFVFVFLYLKEKRKPSVLLISTLILCAWMFLDLFRNTGFYIHSYRYAFLFLVSALATEYFAKKDFRSMIRGLMLNCEIAIYFDTASKLYNLYVNHLPRGGTFFGYYNFTTLISLPAICTAVLYMTLFKNYRRSVPLLFFSILLCFLSTAGTPRGAIIGFMIVVIIEYLLFYKLKLTRTVRPCLWILAATLFGFFLVFLYRPGQLTLLDSFIVNVLHRSLDFTYRTDIWKESLNLISEHPVIGYGYSIYVLDKPHAHNMYLEYLLLYGLIGMVLFVIFNLVYIIEIEKRKDDIYKIVFAGLLFAMHLTFIVDYYIKCHLFVIMIFVIYSFYIDGIDET